METQFYPTPQLKIITVVILITLTLSCTLHPSPSGCTNYSSTTPIMYNSTNYCQCMSCSTNYTIDIYQISCCLTNLTNLTQCKSCLGSSTGGCQQCNTGYGYDASGVCSLCSGSIINCTQCISLTVCTGCISGFFLSGTTCSPCNVVTNCTACTSATNCSSCSSTNYLVNPTTCSSCSIIPNCQICSSATVCTVCDIAYGLLLNNTCQICTSISLSIVMNAGRCDLCLKLMANCQQCTNATLCIKCTDNFAVSNVSLSICEPCSSAINHCITCNSSRIACYTCDSLTFRRADNICYLCNNSRTNCTSCTFDPFIPLLMCTYCNQYSAPLTNGYCYPCSIFMPNCLICNSSTTNCIATINDNYFIQSNTSIVPRCQLCSPTLINCSRCIDSQKCIQCFPFDGIFLKLTNSSYNIPLPGGYFGHNISYNGNYGTCQTCEPTYPNCIRCNSFKCLTCPSSPYITYVNNTACYYCFEVLMLCSTCSNQYTCTQCSSNLYTISTITIDGIDHNICRFCYTLMNFCMICTSTVNCISCTSGQAAIGGCSNIAGCYQVQQLGFRNSTCISCRANQFYPNLINGKCVCLRGHIAGQYCTEMIGCLAIYRSSYGDSCVSCMTVYNFILQNGVCVCFPNYQINGDKCVQICGDGIIIQSKCDDGNTFNFDGCSSTCVIQKGYTCNKVGNGSSSCTYFGNLTITLESVQKIQDANQMLIYFSLYPPTRLISKQNMSQCVNFVSSYLCSINHIETDATFIKIYVDYQQTIKDAYANLNIHFDPSFILSKDFNITFPIKATNGQQMIFDPSAGTSYPILHEIIFIVSIVTLAIFIITTPSYKMIGVETIQTIQLIYIAQIFSIRYSNFFHYFSQLAWPFGQTSQLSSANKLIVKRYFAYLKYSYNGQQNFLVVGGAIFVFFTVFAILKLLQFYYKCREYKNQHQRKKYQNKKQQFKSIKNIVYYYGLFPVTIGFFYHFVITLYVNPISPPLSQYQNMMKSIITYILAFIVSIVVSQQFKYLFIDQLKPVQGKYKQQVLKLFVKPLQIYESSYKYISVFVCFTIIDALIILLCVLQLLRFYYYIGLIITLIKVIIIVKMKPYQLNFHNIILLVNCSAVGINYIWLIMQDFMLLGGIATEIMATFICGCIAAILILALLRAIYNIKVRLYGIETKQQAITVVNQQQIMNHEQLRKKFIQTSQIDQTFFMKESQPFFQPKQPTGMNKIVAINDILASNAKSDNMSIFKRVNKQPDGKLLNLRKKYKQYFKEKYGVNNNIDSQ